MVDLKGQRFGKLVVIEEAGSNKFSKRLWYCKCDCGGDNTVTTGHLKSGNTRSCGCLPTGYSSAIKPVVEKLELGGDNLYPLYLGMRNRCSNENHSAYETYGGRGIKVCDRWLEPRGLGFINFLNDMAPRPSKDHSLDRINGNLNYSPENCRWANHKQQARNRGKCKNNTSGVTGVHRETGYYPKTNTEYNRWIAQWCDSLGRRRKKSFSVEKYGEELAEFLAIEFREKKIWELNKLGAGYTENHGK